MMAKVLIFSLALVLIGAGAARADITFTGTTSASFSSYAGPPPINSIVKWTDGSFSVLVPVSGAAVIDPLQDPNDSLGKLELTPSCGFAGATSCSFDYDVPFTLTFAFTVPTVNGTQTFGATVDGMVTKSKAKKGPDPYSGTVDVVFSNSPQNFSYTTAGGYGTFDLFVDNKAITFNGPNTASAMLTGAIRGLTYFPNSPGNPGGGSGGGAVSQVPEPASILMLGTVLMVGTAFLRRRAKG